MDIAGHERAVRGTLDRRPERERAAIGREPDGCRDAMHLQDWLIRIDLRRRIIVVITEHNRCFNRKCLF